MLTVKDIKIGDLDQRITIQTATEATNDYAEPIPTWGTHATVWAKVDYPTGGNDEEQEANKQTIHRRVEFTIRYLSTVTEKMRVLYDAEAYDILTVQKIGRSGYMKLITELRK